MVTNVTNAAPSIICTGMSIPIVKAVFQFNVFITTVLTIVGIVSTTSVKTVKQVFTKNVRIFFILDHLENAQPTFRKVRLHESRKVYIFYF